MAANGYRFTKPGLQLTVRGDRLREELRSMDGTLLGIQFDRVQ